MIQATITNVINGVSVEVYATTDHPASSYGRAVWVDNAGVAYCEVNCPVPNPFYEVSNVRVVQYQIDNTEGSGSGCDIFFDSKEDALFHINTFYTENERHGLEIVEVQSSNFIPDEPE